MLHLGDYINEHDRAIVRPVLPTGSPADLDGYRQRYASYKVDTDLQAAHARYPFVCMWDDHEVTNNYAGDTDPNGHSPEFMQAQRAAAYRAWWEHIPARLPPPTGADVTLYRSLAVGGLARVTVLDERQYADVPPCRDSAVSDLGNCEARTGADREYLGTAQQDWFSEVVAEKGVIWDLVGNPAVLSGVNAGTPDEPKYFLETWDGYPAARRRFIESLASAAGQAVILTGDYHAGMVADLHADPGDQTTPVVTEASGFSTSSTSRKLAVICAGSTSRVR